MTHRTALALILAIIVIGGGALYLNSTSARTSPALIAAQAQLTQWAQDCETKPNDDQECQRRWTDAVGALNTAQAPLDKERYAHANFIGYTGTTLLSLVTLAWLLKYIPRAYTFARGRVSAWRASRRAAKVSLLADAIRAAQGPPR
jgi:hypothetical protein